MVGVVGGVGLLRLVGLALGFAAGKLEKIVDES